MAEAHPGKRIELWFMAEARIGQKGRTGFRWWVRGERSRGLCDRRFEWASPGQLGDALTRLPRNTPI